MDKVFCCLEVCRESRSYSISPVNLNEGFNVWIQSESGEGMGVKAETFFDLIDKFYKENF